MRINPLILVDHPLKTVGIVASATILGALAIEHAGYPPCTLCLYQRVPYYALCALILIALPLRRSALSSRLYRPLAFSVCFVLLASGALGVFHTGVEFDLWKGPSGCSGTINAANMETLLETLRNTKAVSCTKASFWVLGLSLAAWNAIISFGLAGLVAGGLFKTSGD